MHALLVYMRHAPPGEKAKRISKHYSCLAKRVQYSSSAHSAGTKLSIRRVAGTAPGIGPGGVPKRERTCAGPED
jgi:hypothetical protein